MANLAIEEPPELTGDTGTDLSRISEYLKELYEELSIVLREREDDNE